MEQARRALLAALRKALAELAPDTPVEAAFEQPRQAAHGDLAITCAMQLARPLKKNPRELAQALVAAMQRQPEVGHWVQAFEIAGPGFVNLRLSAAAKQAVVAEVVLEPAQRAHRHRQQRGHQVPVAGVTPEVPHAAHPVQRPVGHDHAVLEGEV